MPNLNKTGPEGEGPMTGRRMGRCTNYGAKLRTRDTDEQKRPNVEPEEDLTDRDSGFGWRSGFGFGRGWGRPGRGSRGRGLGRQNRFRGGC